MRKTYKLIYAFAFALILFGCEDSDNVIDQVLEDVETGQPFLRILNVSNTTLDIFNTDSEINWQLEYQFTPNNPSLEGLSSVDFTVAFTDNFADGVDNSAGPVPFGTLSVSDFEIPGDFGGSVANYSYTLQAAMDALGLQQSQLNGGDVFTIDWEMTLIDGTVVGPDDVSGDVAAVGGYYSAQYRLAASLVCLFDEPDFYTGTYQIEQLTGSDPFFSSASFGTQTVELTADGTVRNFNFIYFPGIFDFEQTFEMNFVCDRIEFSSVAVSGTLGCGEGTITQGNTPGTPTFFDQTFQDDTDLLMYIQDFDDDAGCDTGPNQITVRLTKL